MTQYDNTNRFQIWKNDRKAEDRDPDFTGSATLCCPNCSATFETFMDGWKRRDGANERSPALSGKLKPKNRQPSAPQAQADLTPRRPNGRPAPSYADLDDDIPF
jgi:hypothetical protein